MSLLKVLHHNSGPIPLYPAPSSHRLDRAYSSAKEPYGLKNTPTIISMKLRMQGFIAMDYTSRYPEAQAYLATLASKGQMEYEYTLLEAKAGEEDGLGRCVEGMEMLSGGGNVGKT